MYITPIPICKYSNSKRENQKFINLMRIIKILLYIAHTDLLVEFRYAWSHGITPRKTDVIPTQSGDLTIQQRGERTSFTFRCIRKGECTCVYHDQCDSYKKKNSMSKVHIIDDVLAAQLESLHVHEVRANMTVKCYKQCFIVPSMFNKSSNVIWRKKLTSSSHACQN